MKNSIPRRPAGPARRRAWTLAAVVGLVVPASVAVSAPAQAEALAVTCVGGDEVTYVPGITTTPQPVTAIAHRTYEGPCVTVGLDGPYQLADHTVTLDPVTRSCADLLSPKPDVGYEIRWTDGETSVVNGTMIHTQVGSVLQIVMLGEVVEGRFEGRSYERTVTFANVDALAECQSDDGLDYLGPGVEISVFL